MSVFFLVDVLDLEIVEARGKFFKQLEIGLEFELFCLKVFV